MFFFYFDDSDNSVIKQCLRVYIRVKINNQSFCDISELFSDSLTKEDVIGSLVNPSQAIIDLYKKKYPNNKEDLSIISELFKDKMNQIVNDSETFAILFWAFKVFKNKKTYANNKDNILDALMLFINEDMNEKSWKRFDSIIYDENKTICYCIESVGDYINQLTKYSNEKNTFFYRGHSKASYKLRPSVLRNANLKINEYRIYQELLINCPNDFKGYTHHIDYLVKMQHYGLPTRLLDITRNPLVALYFACCNNYNDMGEVIVFSPQKEQIKYVNSDTVAMLASLPLFTYDEQIALMDKLYVRTSINKEYPNIIERFIHEIQTEKPGFIDRIRWSDVENCYIVLPQKDNNRIVKQDGAFIICGINECPETIINQNLRYLSNGKVMLILVRNKKNILKELDMISINESTLFPEIENVSKYIKTQYEQ